MNHIFECLNLDKDDLIVKTNQQAMVGGMPFDIYETSKSYLYGMFVGTIHMIIDENGNLIAWVHSMLHSWIMMGEYKDLKIEVI